MIFRFFYCFILIIVSSCNLIEDKKSRPNVILFFVDDLGYGELGIYGQKIIQTKNIDELGENGIKFTQFYSGSPVCAPSRSILLTGMHAGHTYIRGNHEYSSRGDVWSYEKMFNDPNLEGQYPIDENTIILSKVLSEAGYNTGMIGKWGLGPPNSSSIPTEIEPPRPPLFDPFHHLNRPQPTSSPIAQNQSNFYHILTH